VFPLVLAALTLGSCPHDGSLGSVTFVRGTTEHRVSLADCVDRVIGRAPHQAPAALRSPDGRFTASIRATGRGRSAKQTIWVTDRRTGRSRAIFSETEYYRTIGPGDTPGPIELLGWSGDARWVFFTIDPGGSGSITADGLILRVVSANGGAVHRLGVMLPYSDYLAWCGGRVVFAGGGDRVATHAKRLLVARPPDWRPRPLWNDPERSFGSLACAPDGSSVAVLSQRSSANPSFFATRWQLWRVGLDGSHEVLDRPPPGAADESPRWSADGRSLLFVRERNGYGRLMLLHRGRAMGPIASLGYSIGYYGHHDWPVRWLP
jgi:dipeptidyl aminopeptidase/acylaminoacyl peptidase